MATTGAHERDETGPPCAGEAGQGAFTAPEDGVGLRARKKQRTREAMHRAALELVAEHGIAHVTVEMIAERALVSPRTFFNYWDTKEAAVLGMVQDQAALAVGLLSERPREEDPRRSLRSVMIALARAVPADADLRRLKKAAMERDPRLSRLSMGSLAEVQTGLVEVVAERLREQGGDEDATTRAHLDVQLAFAVARSAFAASMRRGTAPVDELERMHALIDDGRAGA